MKEIADGQSALDDSRGRQTARTLSSSTMVTESQPVPQLPANQRRPTSSRLSAATSGSIEIEIAIGVGVGVGIEREDTPWHSAERAAIQDMLHVYEALSADDNN